MRYLGIHFDRMLTHTKRMKTTALIQENSKPQDPIVYTDGSVTKEQSGWGFTVKQGASVIHEDSAANTVLTSSLTMEVEAVIMPSAGLPQEVTVIPQVTSSSQIQ